MLDTNSMIALNDSQLIDLAPAIFATKPHAHRSDKYGFVPTIEMINFLREKDIFPVAAEQRMSRMEHHKTTGVHIVRFSLANHFKDIVDEIPQIVMINSHDGSRAYNFSLGIFRLVCSNGLVIKSKDFGEFHMRHGTTYQDAVFDMSEKMLNQFSQVFPRINTMKDKMLSFEEAAKFANSAAHLRYGDEVPYDPKMLLNVRRDEDKGNSLWNVYNVVQENLLTGGFVGINMRNVEKPRKIRAMSDLNATYDINRDLWAIAEEFVS